MLAGILQRRLGRRSQVSSTAKKRGKSLVQILALWPDSSEAQFIRRALRWDDDKGGSRFPHFPRENGELAEMVDHSA